VYLLAKWSFFFRERERESVKSSQVNSQKLSKSIHLLRPLRTNKKTKKQREKKRRDFDSFIVTIEAKPKSKKIRKVRSVLEGHPSQVFPKQKKAALSS